MNIDDLIKQVTDDEDDNNKQLDNLLNDNHIRKAIYIELHNKLMPIHKKIVRKLLKIEIMEREEDLYEDYEMFYWCIFLLSRLGDASDVEIIWKAKCLDFDALIGVDAQFLIGGGLENTLEYLKNKNNDEAIEIMNYILERKDEGYFENLQDWYSFRFNYFSSLCSIDGDDISK